MKDRLKMTNKVGIISLFVNFILTVLKITVGFFGNSKALIADGVHSLSDIASTLIVLISIKFAAREADEEHPYGHGKAETIGTALLGIILLITSLLLIKDNIINISADKISVPGNLTLLIALISIISKEVLFRYVIKAAKSINSKGLIADAHHHRSDAFSSIAALIGILGSKIGYPVLDPVAGFVVSIFIGKIGFEISREAVHDLLDGVPVSVKMDEIETQINEIPEVKSINNIKIRSYGPNYYIDLAIVVENKLNIKEGHIVTDKVKKHLQNKNKNIKEVFIHLDPDE